MALYTGINGAKKEIKKLYTGIGGAKKELKELWAGNAGAKRKIFSSGTPLGSLPIGTIVKLKENGVAQNYIVVQQGLPSSMYDSSCSGTWLLRQDIHSNEPWNSNGNNTFTSATVNTSYLPSLLSIYDSAIQSVIKTVKIPYCVGGYSMTVNSGTNGYSCKLFLLSCYEMGLTQSYNSNIPSSGSKLSYFSDGNTSEANQKRISSFINTPASYWTRDSYSRNLNSTWELDPDGLPRYSNCSYNNGIRPCMVLPTDLLVDDNMSIISA